MRSKFKIKEVNTGFGIVIYSTENSDGEKILYGLQNDYEDHIRFMRCSMDGEPQSTARIVDIIEMEYPTGNSKLEEYCRKYIDAHVMIIKN